MTEPKGASGEPNAPYFLIFTDLDGTLLDKDSYDWSPAVPALELCRGHGYPVVMVSSKTRVEMAPLRTALELRDPFVCENGGAVYFPLDCPNRLPAGCTRSGALWRWALGIPYAELVAALGDLGRELGWVIRGFSDMDPGQIARLTGLDPEASRRAKQREFDEPFVVESPEKPDLAALRRAAAKKGLSITLGGRFLHLKGPHDKRGAVTRLIEWYRSTHPDLVSVALGDSPNDFDMLACADYPVLVRSGRDFPELMGRIPGLRITADPGPWGWNAAVTEILSKQEDTIHG